MEKPSRRLMVLPPEVVLAQSWERELARFQLNRFYRKLFNVEASHLDPPDIHPHVHQQSTSRLLFILQNIFNFIALEVNGYLCLTTVH